MTWDDLPIEIQNKMLEHQEKQGNLRNPDVFKKALPANKDDGGFDWPLTEMSWYKILIRGEFDEFYKQYPKFDLSQKINEIIEKLETI